MCRLIPTVDDNIVGCLKYFRGEDDEKEYLVKYKELNYDECYWEFESDISSFKSDIERFKKFQSRSRRPFAGKQKSSTAETSKNQKDFRRYEHSPEFLSGGTLFCLNIELMYYLSFGLFIVIEF